MSPEKLQQRRKEKESLKFTLEKEVLKDPNNPKKELLWEKAWDMGHAYGIDHVVYYYRDLAELIQ
jgi:hypothetical protein